MALPLVFALGLAACGGQTVGGESEGSGTLSLEEATIRGIHDAFASGTLDCVQLVEYYLRRVEAYDDQGPALNAILTVNPRALDTAREMDRLYAVDGTDGRPLHCIPVIVKDNYDTADMPTTGGSVALSGSVPPDDAFVVRRLREAGALILAKSNLTELARGGTTISSLGACATPDTRGSHEGGQDVGLPPPRSVFRTPRCQDRPTAPRPRRGRRAAKILSPPRRRRLHPPPRHPPRRAHRRGCPREGYESRGRFTGREKSAPSRGAGCRGKEHTAPPTPVVAVAVASTVRRAVSR